MYKCFGLISASGMNYTPKLRYHCIEKVIAENYTYWVPHSNGKCPLCSERSFVYLCAPSAAVSLGSYTLLQVVYKELLKKANFFPELTLWWGQSSKHFLAWCLWVVASNRYHLHSSASSIPCEQQSLWDWKNVRSPKFLGTFLILGPGTNYPFALFTDKGRISRSQHIDHSLCFLSPCRAGLRCAKAMPLFKCKSSSLAHPSLQHKAELKAERTTAKSPNESSFPHHSLSCRNCSQ